MFKAKKINDMTIDEMAAHTLEVITFMVTYTGDTTDASLIEQALIDAGYCIEQMWQEIGRLKAKETDNNGNKDND